MFVNTIHAFLEKLKNPESLAYAFALSILLLILVSLLKYLIANDAKTKDWLNLILEFPIDVCLIIITIIITGYMQGENFALGVILVCGSIIVSILCCVCRRIAIKHSYDEKLTFKFYLFSLFDVVIGLGWSLGIFYKII